MARVSPNKVLVIGAGELGTAVLQQLATHPLAKAEGNSISVLLRESTIKSEAEEKKTKTQHLREQGIELVSGDIDAQNITELATTFANFTTIVGCLGMTGGAGMQSKILEAVLTAKVSRYIPWQFGVDYDIIGPEAGNGLFAEQCQIRKVLRSQSATQWKIISTGMFMSFIFEEYFGVVTKEAVTGELQVNALGSWSNQVTLTDVEDIGKCTAEVVWRWEDVEESIIFTAGDTISYQKIKNETEKASDKGAMGSELSLQLLRKKLAQEPANAIKKYQLVFGEGKGVAWLKEGSFNSRRGISTMTLEQGIRKYLKA